MGDFFPVLLSCTPKCIFFFFFSVHPRTSAFLFFPSGLLFPVPPCRDGGSGFSDENLMARKPLWHKMDLVVHIFPKVHRFLPCCSVVVAHDVFFCLV